MIPLSQIKSNPNNPRIIKDDKFKKLVQSIKDFPKMMALRPIVVDKDGIVQGGNMRLKALIEAGYKEVPEEWIARAENFTEDELREFIVKDNVSFGEWNWEDLANDWDQKELIEWGLDNGESDQTDCELAWANFRSVVRQFTQASEKTNRVHPTQKPVTLVSWIMKRFNLSSKTIADYFGGSGVTMVAAEQMGKKSFLMEHDPKYCQVIIDRMLKLDPTLEIKRNGEVYKKRELQTA